MSRTASDRPNPCFKFLRRLQAGGRSNMYGAIPYLTATFGCTREEAFRIVCDWLDQQAVAVSEQAATVQSERQKPRRKASRGKAA
jgi:hypothetical protein